MERRSLKISRLQRDSTPWPPQYRCNALPTELWNHTLGARSIFTEFISPMRSEMIFSGFFFPIAYIRYFTAMIILHFHLQPQFKWIISYISHHFTPLGRYELNKLTSLPMCGFLAQLVEHRSSIAEVTG